MKITPTQIARKWTKERLKRHPGSWTIEQREMSVPCWPGELAIHMKNLSDGWSAWFPLKDIIISHEENNDRI